MNNALTLIDSDSGRDYELDEQNICWIDVGPLTIWIRHHPEAEGVVISVHPKDNVEVDLLETWVGYPLDNPDVGS